MLGTIGREQIFEFGKRLPCPMLVNEPSDTVAAPSGTHVAAYIKNDELGCTDLPEGNTDHAAIGFFDELGDFAVFAATAVPHF